MANASLIADVKARTGDFERGMDRAKGKTDSFLKTMFAVEGVVGRASRGAALGLNVLREGLDLAGVSAEGFAGDALKVSANIATGFAIGGPVGAALAATKAAIDAIGGALGEADAKAQRLQDTMRKTIASQESRIYAIDKVKDEGELRARLAKAEDEIALRRRQAEEASTETQRRNAEALLGAAMRYADAIKDRIALLSSEADVVGRTTADMEKQALYASYLKADIAWLGSNLRGVGAAIADGAAEMERIATATKAWRSAFGPGGGGGSGFDSATAWARMGEGHQGPAGTPWMPSMDDWSSKMQEMAEAEKEAAAAAMAHADASERTSRAVQSTTNGIRQQLDITKRFAAIGGGGMFGFGAGQVGGTFSDIGLFTRTRRTRGAGGAGGAEVGRLSAAAGALDAATGKVGALGQVLDKVSNAVMRFASATTDAIERVGAAATSAVNRLRDAQNDLRSRVRNIEDRLAKASALGSGA